MAFKFPNLDERTRKLMLKEIDYDMGRMALYISDRLTAAGRAQYPSLLRSSVAVEAGTELQLAQSLRSRGLIKTSEERRKPNGGFTTVKVPENASDMIAEGEFNRFYIRALCLRAIEDSLPQVVIYRAKEVSSPRRESENRRGQKLKPQALLDDLRTNIGVDTALVALAASIQA